jgi:outer membrane lipase/esterase
MRSRFSLVLNNQSPGIGPTHVWEDIMARRLAGLTALVVALTSTTAMAQSRFVAFGDSLSDNGNLFLLSGGTAPPGGGAPVYPSQRFSSGLTFAEIFAGGPMLRLPFITPATVNSGNVNFAVGGSRTSGPMTPGPTTEQQIGIFLGNGGRFGAGDTVTHWAGANNIFQAIPGAAAVPATAQATMAGVANAAAADIGAQLRTLAGAGAPTIVSLNLPNFSGLPAYNFGAGAPANGLAGFSSTTFNGALAAQQAAAAAANPGTNLISVDVASVFTAVQANPGAFGFANARDACVRVAACLGNPAAYNTYAFWDDVHPTEAGYRLVANVVNQHVQAPRLAGLFSALGESVVRDRNDGITRAFGRLDTLRSAGNAYFVNVIGASTTSDAQANRPGVDQRSFGVHFGMDRALSNVWGLTMGGTITTGTLDVASGLVKADTFHAAVDVAAIYNAGPFFAKFGGGLGLSRFDDMKRRTVGPLDNASRSTGLAYNLAAEVGSLHSFGMFDISPRARLAWVHGNIDKINEVGIVAPLAINSHDASALIGTAELRLGATVLDNGAQKVKLTGIIGYEHYFTWSGNSLDGRIIGNTARGFRNVTGDPKGAGLILGVGASASLSATTAFTAEYRAQIGQNDQTRHIGHIGLNMTF